MAITTLTLNGVQIETTASLAEIMSALPTSTPAQQPKAGNQPPQPKAEAERKSVLPPKGEEVEAKRITPKAEAERIDAKARAAAKAADEAHDNERPAEAPKVTRKRNHKADCGCPTCPKGVEARRAKAAAKQAPKADAPKEQPSEPKAKQQPKAAEVLAEQEAAALQREAERVLAKSLEQAEGLAKALDLTGLKEATRQCLVLANRNERLGNISLYEAYKDSADLFQDALNEAKANTLA